MAEIKLPFETTGKIVYKSNLDSSVMNEILQKSDENDIFLNKLLNAIMGKNGAWDSSVTYKKYDIVGSGKKLFMSKKNDNLGNNT